VAVDADAADGDEDDIEGADDDARCGCGGTLSEVEGARAEGGVGVADEGG
jgi:hypothetical protein